MASNLYNKGLLKLLNGTINPLTDTIEVLLVGPAHVFDKAHEFVSQVTSQEVANDVGTGYERKALANKSYGLDEAGDRVFFDANNVVYSIIKTDKVLHAAIIYKKNTNDADSELIAMIDFPDLVTNGSDVEVIINENGVFQVNNVIA